MLAFERREEILAHMIQDKRVIIGELAESFGVSDETIRRDLKKLEKEGLLTRFHGGASTNQLINEELPYQTRNQSNIKEKQYIGKKLADIVKEGETLFVDSSSTSIEGIQELNKQNKSGVSIITNSVSLLTDLRDSKINIFSTGGELRSKSHSLVGVIAQEAIKHYYGDIAVFGCKGISINQGVTESNEAEKQIKRHMQKQVKKVILLADHSKFDQVAFVRLFSIDKINCVITDREPSKEWRDYFKNKGIELVY